MPVALRGTAPSIIFASRENIETILLAIKAQFWQRCRFDPEEDFYTSWKKNSSLSLLLIIYILETFRINFWGIQIISSKDISIGIHKVILIVQNTIPQRCSSIAPFIIEQSKGTRLISPRNQSRQNHSARTFFTLAAVPFLPSTVSVHFRDASKPKTSTQWYIVTGHFFITPPVIHAREYRIRKSSEHATIRSRLHSFSPLVSHLSLFKPRPRDPIEISRESR